MKSSPPLWFILSGIALIATGFLYDVMFAGIPYQDPTPELSARYAFHSGITSAFLWIGTIDLLIGCGFAVTARFHHRS